MREVEVTSEDNTVLGAPSGAEIGELQYEITVHDSAIISIASYIHSLAVRERIRNFGTLDSSTCSQFSKTCNRQNFGLLSLQVTSIKGFVTTNATKLQE